MRSLNVLTVCALVAASASVSYANSFYGATDELGYSGTVWNITKGTGPWTTNSPRDASLYFVNNAPQYWTNYNQLLSSWYEFAPSNQNDSFIQLSEDGNASVTSANASWDATKTIFSMTVTGADAPYPYSRFWQPDQGMAWGVTFINYTYSFSATFAAPATLDANNFLVSSGDATSIVGSFTGTFQSTDDVNKQPISGDFYGFDIAFSKVSFDSDISGTPYAEFGVAVPLPASAGVGLVTLAGLGTVFAFRKYRSPRLPA